MFGNVFDSAGGKKSENAGLDVALEWFKTFDKYFPLLAGGVPPRVLPRCVEAMLGLKGLFSHKKSSDLAGFVSDIVRFRQSYLHQHCEGVPRAELLACCAELVGSLLAWQRMHHSQVGARR